MAAPGSRRSGIRRTAPIDGQHGTVYGGPFSIAATSTVKFRAFDNAGNAEAINAPLIDVDTAVPDELDQLQRSDVRRSVLVHGLGGTGCDRGGRWLGAQGDSLHNERE